MDILNVEFDKNPLVRGIIIGRIIVNMIGIVLMTNVMIYYNK